MVGSFRVGFFGCRVVPWYGAWPGKALAWDVRLQRVVNRRAAITPHLSGLAKVKHTPVAWVFKHLGHRVPRPVGMQVSASLLDVEKQKQGLPWSP
jgi:hypothetical protein